jgi:hypothetical protein
MIMPRSGQPLNNAEPNAQAGVRADVVDIINCLKVGINDVCRKGTIIKNPKDGKTLFTLTESPTFLELDVYDVQGLEELVSMCQVTHYTYNLGNIYTSK